MGSSESQKPVFMSWVQNVQTLRTLESSRIIGCEDSKGLELLGSCEFLMSNVQRCATIMRLDADTCLDQTSNRSKVLLVFEGPLIDKRGQKVKRVVLKRVSVKVGSSLPVCCMAS